MVLSLGDVNAPCSEQYYNVAVMPLSSLASLASRDQQESDDIWTASLVLAQKRG